VLCQDKTVANRRFGVIVCTYPAKDTFAAKLKTFLFSAVSAPENF